MKSIKAIIGVGLLMLGAIGFASCSQEEDDAVIQEKGNLLKIRTSVADSRGVITGTTFQQGDEIGICVTTVDGHDYTGNSQNIRATYTGSDWRLERDVELREDEAVVYAYYPYDAHATDSIDINLAPATTPEQTDYLYGNCQGVSLNNSTANIRFNHALARITLAVTKGVNDVGEGVVSAAKIVNGYYTFRVHPTGELVRLQGNSISIKGKMSVKTGEIVKINNPEDYISSFANLVIDESVQNIEFMIIPNGKKNAEGSLLIPLGGICAILTIDGKDYEISLPNVLLYEAGQQYTYPITVNRTSVSDPSVIREAVYMGFNGDDGKPLYWSVCNLGASTPEDYGGLYGWGDPTGENTSTNLNDYPSANPPADISGTEYDVVRAMWGNEWRMPSQREFRNLMNSCICEWATQKGISGFLFTSKSNGNKLFLPRTPERVGTEVEWYDLGSSPACDYWTSTLNAKTPERALCFLFAQDDDFLAISTGGYRYEGHPIRPVYSQP